MSDAVVTALIAGVVGLATGAIGSLAAPWAHWGVEKRRKRLERRTQLIDHWRCILGVAEFDRAMVLNDPSFGVLRPLLSAKALEQVERPSNHVIAVLHGATDSPDRDIFLREVARIECEWKVL